MLIRAYSNKRFMKFLNNKVSFEGVLVSIIILLGLFGPWLTYSYDSYSTLNRDTRMGQLNYHSKVELNPLFGSMYKDDFLVERYWIITPGVFLAGILLAISAIFSIFKYTSKVAHFLLFIVASLGLLVFFLNVGEGISIGVFTKIGWGIKLTGIGLFLLFVVSFREMNRNSISRYMD